MASPTQTLLDLEKRLMDPEVRRGDAAAELIADDFMEFAGNGRIFNKADALVVMRRHAPRILAMEEFSVRELSPVIASRPIGFAVRETLDRRAASPFAVQSGCSGMVSGRSRFIRRRLWREPSELPSPCRLFLRDPSCPSWLMAYSNSTCFHGPRCRSNISAIDSTTSSSQGFATNCTPIGKPSLDFDIGTTAPGIPKRLNHSQ